MQPVSGRPPAAWEPKLFKQLGAAGSSADPKLVVLRWACGKQEDFGASVGSCATFGSPRFL